MIERPNCQSLPPCAIHVLREPAIKFKETTERRGCTYLFVRNSTQVCEVNMSFDQTQGYVLSW